MKRNQKRYSSEKQITDEIDAVKFQAQGECFEAERLAKQADVDFLFCSGFPKPEKLEGKKADTYNARLHSAKLSRAAAKKLRNHQSALANRLNTLKDKLRAFNTQTMPFLPDKSVV